MALTTSNRARALIALSLLQLTAGACTDPDDSVAVGAGQTVMLIDDGIDPTHPILAGKVLASYTVECRDEAPPDGGPVEPAPDGGVPLAEARAALLAELARPDEACHLRPGIAARGNPFADLEGEREEWNATVLNDQPVSSLDLGANINKLYAELARRLPEISFHGTATAGLIAFENASARLVLVDEALGSAAETEAQFTCFTQESIDESVALLSDPEVRTAFVMRPSTVERELEEARTTYGVGIVSESFGRPSRLGVEVLLAKKMCKRVSLGPYFALLSALERARSDRAPPVLLVKSAGNDGSRLFGPGDDIDCQPDHPRRVLVGSYGRERERSYFSNQGPCVETYAPGEHVVVSLPGEWLFPLNGTSFSAPLVTRLLTIKSPAPFQPESARALLLSLREPNGDLALRFFPPALIHNIRLPRREALTLKTSGDDPALERPTRRALQAALWPLRLVERHRSAP